MPEDGTRQAARRSSLRGSEQGRAPTRRERPALDALTSVRFFAAFYVAVFHWAKPHPPAGWPTPLRNIALTGYIGVSLFFVLSGFILSYNYAPRESGGQLDKRGFWVARFARIYPVYLFGLVIALPFFLKDSQKHGNLTAGHVGGVGAAVLSLTQAWIPHDACQWNCPGWTLSDEAFFYAVFPFVLAPLLFLPTVRLAGIAVGVWFLSLLGPAYAAAGLPGAHTVDLFVEVDPVMRLPEFLIGMALGITFLRRAADGQFPKRARRSITLAACGSLLVLVVLLATSSRIPEVLLRTSLATPLFACILFALAVSIGRAGQVMSWRALVLLGEASYALYIIHQPLLSYLSHGLVYLLTVVGASIIVVRVLEQPARRTLRKALTSESASRR